MVSSEQIKRKFLEFKAGNNKKMRCGCIQSKVITLGSTMWILDFDLMCMKHKAEHAREFSTQSRIRIKNEINDNNKKNKRKVIRKKGIETEH